MIMWILWILLLLILGSFVYGGLRAAPWVPTFPQDRSRIMKLADIEPGDVFLELGCGSGGILQAAAQQGATAIGYEVSLLPYCIAKIRSLFTPRMSVKFRDFWMMDLSKATHVYCYLLPKIYPKLKEKCERELKPSAKILLYVWGMDEWKATLVDTMKDAPKIYVYEPGKQNAS